MRQRRYVRETRITPCGEVVFYYLDVRRFTVL